MIYYKELDGLRFFAVLLVIISHWLPKSHFLNLTPNGAIGVTIFFVLSGFLISNILLKYKERIDTNEISLKEALRVFFIRRSLRIFPIYYILIAFLYLYGVPAIKDNIIYFLTYTSNILMFNEQSFLGNVSHLWTLAVEEQYYLFWPIILLILPKNYIKTTVIILILIAVISQYIMDRNFEYYSFLTFNAFDSFGLGSILAYFRTNEQRNIRKFNYFLLVITPILVCLQFLQIRIVSIHTLTSLISVLLIIFITKPSNANSYINKVLKFPPFMFIGKISYGIYLYHTFIPGIMDHFYPENVFFLNPKQTHYLFIVFNFIILIIISTSSWFLIESPLNSLKDKFQILRRKPSPILEKIENISS